MNLNHSSDDWPDMTGPVFFRAFRVSSAFLTKNSQMTSPILGLDTRQAVYDWINGLYRAAAALLAHILCHQSWEQRTRVHRWPGGETRDCHCYQNCVRNTTLWPVLCIQLITHFTPQLTILGQICQTCEMGKSKLLLFTLLSLSICDDNIWPVSGGGRREM